MNGLFSAAVVRSDPVAPFTSTAGACVVAHPRHRPCGDVRGVSMRGRPARGIDAELKRLTDALAAGVGVASIAEAVGSRDAERQRLRGELAALDALPTLDADDRARIRGELFELLDDWRGLLKQQVAQARQILRKLLIVRVRFVPETRDGVAGDRLEAEGTLRPLLAAFIPQMVSPTGTGGMYEK